VIRRDSNDSSQRLARTIDGTAPRWAAAGSPVLPLGLKSGRSTLDKQQRRRTEPDADEVDCVWEAIALHSSLGIAHRRGLLTYLTHRGVFIDAGRDTGLPADLIQRVRAAYPHQAGKRYLADAIADHASRSEAAAPPGSLGFELLRQRRAEAALKR
jgi:hypothetical protein